MPPKSSKQTKGGSLVDDVNKLVVPFGLLLAERGLSKMMKNDKKNGAKHTSPMLENNKRAAVGGKTKKASATKKGGATSSGSKKLVSEFNQLTDEIEKFLSKY
jgi:hypothetical protein